MSQIDEKVIGRDGNLADNHFEGSEKSEEEDALRMTPAEEKKLLRRIDLWIVPYASL
jgi:hypothetical protein